MLMDPSKLRGGCFSFKAPSLATLVTLQICSQKTRVQQAFSLNAAPGDAYGALGTPAYRSPPRMTIHEVRMRKCGSLSASFFSPQLFFADACKFFGKGGWRNLGSNQLLVETSLLSSVHSTKRRPKDGGSAS